MESLAGKHAYVEEKVTQGWTQNVIASRRGQPLDCCGRTLYRMFRPQTFDSSTLPMQGKIAQWPSGTPRQTSIQIYSFRQEKRLSRI